MNIEEQFNPKAELLCDAFMSVIKEAVRLIHAHGGLADSFEDNYPEDAKLLREIEELLENNTPENIKEFITHFLSEA
jgi:hypothetical protein